MKTNNLLLPLLVISLFISSCEKERKLRGSRQRGDDTFIFGKIEGKNGTNTILQDERSR